MTQRIFGLDRLSEGAAPLRVVAALLALMAAGVGVSLWAAPGVPGWLGAGLALIVLAIAVIDARLFIIPDELTIAGFVLALINAAVISPFDRWEAVGVALLRGAVLALLFFALRTGYRRLRGREGIGLGDVKLAGVAGAWLSLVVIPIAVEIAALAAIALFCARHYAAGKPIDTALKFPFGLFFAPAIWIGWLLDTLLFS
ncbi:MAG TPA: A24 family peptidase [Xanthobacteraceae bacterium]|nr:A24 family peptidase [Xanthobacteraceae bacterium]